MVELKKIQVPHKWICIVYVLSLTIFFFKNTRNFFMNLKFTQSFCKRVLNLFFRYLPQYCWMCEYGIPNSLTFDFFLFLFFRYLPKILICSHRTMVTYISPSSRGSEPPILKGNTTIFLLDGLTQHSCLFHFNYLRLKAYFIFIVWNLFLSLYRVWGRVW